MLLMGGSRLVGSDRLRMVRYDSLKWNPDCQTARAKVEWGPTGQGQVRTDQAEMSRNVPTAPAASPNESLP